MPEVLDSAREVLQAHWGFDQFRPAQEKVILAALNGEDVLAVLPTGYGKSATFQVPALMSEGTAIVISPLIALMKDQADDCKKRGIPASYINSHVSDKEVHTRFNDLIGGAFKVFYIAPERLSSPSFREAIQLTNVSFIVVDEAHCVSRWGHDFRPAYSKIKNLVDMVSVDGQRPPIMAVTATATRDIEADIMKGCGIEGGYARIVGDPIRPNLAYKVMQGNPWGNLRVILKSWDVVNGRYIIYCGTRKGAEKVALMAEEHLEDGCVGFYHAGMDKDARIKAQNAFKSGEKPVVVATCAFGMGIDVPNIRSVVHFGIPGSIEDYCQEAGRAGRDGKHSDVILIADDYSINLRQMFINFANPPYAVYQHVWEWLHANLDQGEVLTMSGDDIAKEMTKEYGVQIEGEQVLAALSTMDAHALVVRRNASGGLNLKIDRDKLKAFIAAGVPNPLLRKAAEYLHNDVLSALSGPNEMNVIVDQATAAECSDMSDSTFAKMCELLEDKSVLSVEKSFRGKSTQIAKYGVDLDDVLPRAEIEAKRKREQARLDYMVGYTKSPDRIKYIRSYFLGGDE